VEKDTMSSALEATAKVSAKAPAAAMAAWRIGRDLNIARFPLKKGKKCFLSGACPHCRCSALHRH